LNFERKQFEFEFEFEFYPWGGMGLGKKGQNFGSKLFQFLSCAHSADMPILK